MVFTYKSRTDRLMARVAIAIFSLGAIYGILSFGRPIYWRFYATVLRPFEDGGEVGAVDVVLDDDPFSAAAVEKNHLHGASPPPIVVKKKEKKPFDVNDYNFSKELVHGLLQDGYIMVTWANHHYLDFAKSWVFHVKKCGVTGYLVGAMDDEILESLAKHDINTWRMNSGIVKGDLGWGSNNFHKMGRVKISLIKQFLEIGVDVLISDIDTAWLQNPLPYFSRYPEAQILTSTDQLGPTVQDDSLELWPQAGASFNIGIMLFRPASMTFVEEWIKKLEDPKMWDQTAFNDLVRQGATHSNSSMKNLWYGDNNKLVVGILPASIFASGHTFFVQRKYEELGLKPYVAHATFQYSGTPGKRNRFREFLLWDDPPEYFDHDKGFIHFKIDVPQAMLDNSKGFKSNVMTADLLVNHMKLVHYQILRLRTALAIATATGRVIVMPPIWCEVDKYWAPLGDGNIPGSHFKKPFICPMDHVFDIEGWWHRVIDANGFGPHIEFREYSFFQNPRLTPAVNNSRLVVQPCVGGSCAGGSKTTGVKDGKISVAGGVDIVSLKQALTSPEAAKFKVLELPSATIEALSGIWNTFPEKEQGLFTNRLKHYTSVVCCLANNPGWVWYDFLNDIPHKDRFQRDFPDGSKLTFYLGDGGELGYQEK